MFANGFGFVANNWIILVDPQSRMMGSWGPLTFSLIPKIINVQTCQCFGKSTFEFNNPMWIRIYLQSFWVFPLLSVCKNGSWHFFKPQICFVLHFPRRGPRDLASSLPPTRGSGFYCTNPKQISSRKVLNLLFKHIPPINDPKMAIIIPM